MLGLFGTLMLGARSLETQRQGIEVAGHNLANVNNPAYARQRIKLQTSETVPSTLGPQGTGAEATAILQLRSSLLDNQITTETSVSGSLESQQAALQYAEASLGQQIDRQSTGAEGASASSGVAGQQGIAENMSDLFNGFQSLSTSPTSLAERQVLLMKAQNLAGKFGQVDHRLSDLSDSLNRNVTSDVGEANRLITEITSLNKQIFNTELNSSGVANDLRDTRQQRLEDLAKVVRFDSHIDASGNVQLSIDGQSIISGVQTTSLLESYDAGGGRMMVRTAVGATPLNITGGSLHGGIDVRDNTVGSLRSSLNTLASNLITQVNALHSGGFGLGGTTGQPFFTGSSASTMGVNATLVSDASLIQASGTPGAAGDNQVALALAQLNTKPLAALGNQTFAQSYAQTVASLGQTLASVNGNLADQQTVNNMLKSQRDSVSGVSMDEEMTDLMKYQKAYQASAKLISTVDAMLDVVMSIKR